jgi:hypothetical protein
MAQGNALIEAGMMENALGTGYGTGYGMGYGMDYGMGYEIGLVPNPILAV